MLDIVQRKKRKSNMKLFPIYQMIGLDLFVQITYFCAFGAIISTHFFEIDNIKSNKENIRYVQDLKSAFSFILKSNRLRSLLIILGFIWGILILFGTYKITLLKDLNISATYIGIISAVLSIMTGRMSTLSNKFNEKYKNKTLVLFPKKALVFFVVIRN